MNKKLIIILFITLLSISFVSAGFFDNLFNKNLITGRLINLGTCNNNILDKGEECDPPGLTGTCSELAVYYGVNPEGWHGTVYCTKGCTIDYHECYFQLCGNNIIESGEQCEPPNTPTCNSNCQIIQKCVLNQGQSCGNCGTIDCNGNCIGQGLFTRPII